MLNKELETMPRKGLEELQLERLRSTIERASSLVPFYTKALAGAPVLGKLIDIAKLPFTTKSDLRDNYPFGCLAVPRNELRRIHVSSGTRGKPTVAPYTRADLDLWAELCARSLACAGINPGDVVQNSYGYGLFTGGLGIHYGIERLGATAVPASSGRTQQQIMLLQDFGARALCCTPSYALNIALSLQDSGIARSSLALEIGIFGAETWTESARAHIEAKLGIRAYDIYGLSEILGPGIAVECTAQNGLHIWEDHFFPEIIDPVTGEPVAEGESGELVLTTLTKQAVPLIRHRTGDACAFLPEGCACGRTMRRITRIQGRLDDMLIIKGVNVYPSEIERVLYSCPEVSPHYQIVVTREKALDALTIRFELDTTVAATWAAEKTEEVNHRQLEQSATDLLRQKLGLTASVEIIPPNILPRSEGKAVRLLDLRSDD